MTCSSKNNSKAALRFLFRHGYLPLYNMLYSHIAFRLRKCPADPPMLTAQQDHIRLEASPVCQLRCPSCPTTKGIIRRSPVGTTLLAFADFKQLVDVNPWIKSIELSNWGEIFLNPDILTIIKYAYEKNIALTAKNGANFNHVRDEVLEALVKYRFNNITCSIDGATQDTYVKYRKRGNFDRVIANIRRLNNFKAQYNSPYPVLSWQFILFEHNKHELEAARAMAQELNMAFYSLPSWDKRLVAKPDPVSAVLGDNSAAKMIQESEFNRKKTFCHQLWIKPQINSDGKILGCCVNYWGDFGNAFGAPNLHEALNNEKIQYARKMLAGYAPAKRGIPCTNCRTYSRMQREKNWINGAYIENQSSLLTPSEVVK